MRCPHMYDQKIIVQKLIYKILINKHKNMLFKKALFFLLLYKFISSTGKFNIKRNELKHYLNLYIFLAKVIIFKILLICVLLYQS